jgi:hypothetical protein
VLGARAQKIELVPPPGRQIASFFVWPLRTASAPAEARLVVEWNDATIMDVPFRDMRHVQRLEFDTGGKPGTLRVRLDSNDSGSEAPRARWGYVNFYPRTNE